MFHRGNGPSNDSRLSRPAEGRCVAPGKDERMGKMSIAPRCLCVLVAVLAGASAAAQDLPGDPSLGRGIAERWCTECHVVEPSVREPGKANAPAFQEVSDDPAVTETALRTFLQTPHENMPDVKLTSDETGDIVAYILSLRGR
ncbi:MAG: hypothetical protein ACREGL_02235 [Alphaproteobacteria bacterium]